MSGWALFYNFVESQRGENLLFYCRDREVFRFELLIFAVGQMHLGNHEYCFDWFSVGLSFWYGI